MRRALMIATLICSVCCPAWAVKTQMWTHEEPKDFIAGEIDGVNVSSSGEVTLARKTHTLYELEDQGEIINALARAGDGKLYIATGPKGVIYQLDGDTLTEFVILPEGGTVLSLLFAADGMLLAGTGGGEQATIYRIDGQGRASVFFQPPKARYIWAMARGSEGQIYAATGVEGQVFEIAPDGKTAEIIADVKPKNVLCLAFGPRGRLYAGSDEEGLIYRLDLEKDKPFVMYDAAESEISSIVFDDDGNLYAATASADEAKPGRAIADKPGGKPDHTAKPTTRPRKIVVVTRDGDKKKATSKPTGTQPASEDAEDEKAPATRRVGLPAGAAKGKGNAIYRINSGGFVTEVFRMPVIILAMVEAEGTLYVATGNEGRLYTVTPDEEETTMLAKLEPRQLTTLLRLPDGRVITGSANPPVLTEVVKSYRSEGTLTSQALDADQIVNWGQVTCQIDTPEGTAVTIATRSGNVEDIESEAWTEYSDELDAATSQYIASINARFLQYRVTLKTTDNMTTPTLRKIEIARSEENQPPLVSKLMVGSALALSKKPGTPPKLKAMAAVKGPGGLPSPQYVWAAVWEASDPNKDPLTFDVFYRQIGKKRWIRIAKELDGTMHAWDTQTMPDGNYEVRVVASDVKGNPPGTERTNARISDPILIDNTPPEIEIRSVEQEGKDTLAVHAVVSDTASRILDASYSVDSDEKWVPAAAADDVFDSPSESIILFAEKLEPGEHRIAIRARDAQGNIRFATVSSVVR